jgi:hypothetical protein
MDGGASASYYRGIDRPVCRRLTSLTHCGSAALLDVGYVLLILRYRPVTHLLCWRLCIALFLSVPVEVSPPFSEPTLTFYHRSTWSSSHEFVNPKKCARCSNREASASRRSLKPGSGESELDDFYCYVIAKLLLCRLFILTPSGAYCGRKDMRLEEHFESSPTLQRNERVKLAASFWNNIGAGRVIGGMAAAFFLDKPPDT